MPQLRQTHTYVELELSPFAYAEIKGKLEAAGYDHAFLEDGAIDMHGLAVTKPAPFVDSRQLDLVDAVANARAQRSPSDVNEGVNP